MAKNSRSKLPSTIKSLEEELFRDNGQSKEEREFELAVEKAFKANKIPVECIEYVPVYDDIAAKVVVYKEC